MAPADDRSRTGREQEHRTAFGLALSIDPRISIPGIAHRHNSTSTREPSVIRLSSGRELERRWDRLATPPARTRELRLDGDLVLTVDFAEPAGYLLWAKEFARVLISPDGMELLCDPDPANDDWASILSAQALPLAATIRGLEVMHASGVVLGGRALLFTGPPGAGKSSLAAAFVRAGAQLLSDDAVALQLREGALTAHVGSAVLQLRGTEDERLSEEARTALGRQVRSPWGKQRYESAHAPDSAPLAGLFLLARSADGPALEQLPAVNPFELIGSTFNLSVRTPARLQRQLDVVSAIAAGGLAHRLRVQPHVDATQLAATVRERFASDRVDAVALAVDPDIQHALEL
ncbi:MAG TPA: hypothetical protein VK790_09245 [Solirubrobacteraceae bacterium]|jgi:hypothetical protein|nr:hypothetical protein [Solirubrobacteraceae bacterium]